MSRKDMKIEEIKQALNEKNNLSYNSLLSVSMFDWGDFGRDVLKRPEIIEMWLTFYGSIALQKQGEQVLIAPTPSRCGKLDMFGFASEIVAPLWGGNGEIRGEVDKDVYLLYNNDNYTNDAEIFRTSAIQSEIDVSKEFNVKWSRVAPIIRCFDSRNRDQLEQIIKNIFNGKIENIISENVVSGLLGTENNDITPIFLTTPDQIKNIQYLSELYDVESRKLYSKYGMNVQTNSKHAQVNNAELHGYDSISWVLPLSKMRRRNDLITWYNEKFGTNYAPIEFNEPWRTEFEKYLNSENIDSETEVEKYDESSD